MARKKVKRKVKKTTSKTARKNYKVSQIKEDTKQRRKFARGGRIEAYTMGEALGKGW